MKPFNLEAVKAGKPIENIHGLPMKFIAHVPEAKPDQRLVVMYGGTGTIIALADNTDFVRMVNEKKEGWVNVCHTASGVSFVNGKIFESEDDAKRAAIHHNIEMTSQVIDTIKIEWTE